MGKLTDIVNKGVRLIVTDSADAAAASPEAAPEREIPPAAFEDVAPKRVARSSVAAGVLRGPSEDPALDSLRGEPRFAVVMRDVRRRMAAERSEVEAMRAAGELPSR